MINEKELLKIFLNTSITSGENSQVPAPPVPENHTISSESILPRKNSRSVKIPYETGDETRLEDSIAGKPVEEHGTNAVIDKDVEPIPAIRKHQITSGPDCLEHLLGEFLNELERNQNIIKKYSGDRLLPLETTLWEANQRMVRDMIPNLKNKFIRLYDDINQINNLVWLATEFNHTSPSMCVQYRKLSEIIAANLDKMIKRIRCFNQVERALALISVSD